MDGKDLCRLAERGGNSGFNSFFDIGFHRHPMPAVTLAAPQQQEEFTKSWRFYYGSAGQLELWKNLKPYWITS